MDANILSFDNSLSHSGTTDLYTFLIKKIKIEKILYKFNK